MGNKKSKEKKQEEIKETNIEENNKTTQLRGTESTKSNISNNDENVDIDKDFNSKYEYNTDNVLGSGSYGTVYKGKNKISNEEVAIKIVTKAKDLDVDQLIREVKITKSVFFKLFLIVKTSKYC